MVGFWDTISTCPIPEQDGLLEDIDEARATTLE